MFCSAVGDRQFHFEICHDEVVGCCCIFLYLGKVVVDVVSFYACEVGPMVVIVFCKRVRLYPWSLSYLVFSVSVGIAFAVAKGK